MIPHPFSLARKPVPGILLALGLLTLALLAARPATTSASAPPQPNPVLARELARQDEIAALERQIADLTKRLAALKKAPVPIKPMAAEPTLPTAWTSSLHWRCIGPASMGGRIVAFSVYEADPTTYWIATASGGLLKTTNNGTTFEHQFDREATVSIGDVCVAPSDKNIVWVGTGEHNPRNSVSYGDGVYKSTNGGKTWQNMGLKQSFQIGRIVVHPKNPDIVYVGALGRLYGPSEERGLFKTTDGGKTWNRIHYIDRNTGVIELKMHPTNPETLLVATWERQRDGFDSHAGALAAERTGGAKVEPPLSDGYDAYDPTRKWGPGSGLFKTTDGGKTWKKLTKGLPTNPLGRIGLDYYRKDPNIVYALVDCEKLAMGRAPGFLGVMTENAPGGVRLSQVTADNPAARAGLLRGDVITAVVLTPMKGAVIRAAIKNNEEFSAVLGKSLPGDKLALTILRGKETKTIDVTLGERPIAVPVRRLDFKGEPGPTGVRVLAVFPRGMSARAGLQIGDVITLVGKKKVTKVQEILDAFRAAKTGDKLTITIVRGKQTRDLAITVQPAQQRRTSRPFALWPSGQRENAQNEQGPDSFEYGGIFRSADGGETWERINSLNPRPMYFSQIRVDPSDNKQLFVLGIRMYRSTNGGKTFQAGGDNGVHADQHALWIDPRDGRHLLVGCDGGSYVSYDRGSKWDYLNHTAIGQFYHVALDNRRPYRAYGGMQDNGSWGGPSRSLDGRGPLNSDWVMVQGGDGFVCRVDPVDPDIVYSESQEGNMFRSNLKTGERALIRPNAPAGQPPYRFNWNAPMIVSSHNPRIFYCAGNHVFRSLNRGDDPRKISRELTRSGKGSATALAESPRNSEILWVGTDDGNLWMTRDGGTEWTNVIANVGLPKSYWVATIEPSRFVEGRCYVCFDAHRSDNDDPWIYVTEDFGATWKSLRGNLPGGSSRCLREDLFNSDVLYLGTEFCVWASIDRGASWTKINNNLPTVAIHELAQHPTAGEMVAATHGRSLWVVEVTALRQLKPAMVKAPATLLAPNTAIRWRQMPRRGTVYGSGSREYFGENPQPGAHIYYALTKKAGKVRLVVQDFAGKTLATLPVKNGPGLHRVTWNLRGDPPTPISQDAMAPRQPGPQRRRGGPGQGEPPGQYRIVLTVDGVDFAQGLRVENDPTLPVGTIIAEDQPTPQKRTPILDH